MKTIAFFSGAPSEVQVLSHAFLTPCDLFIVLNFKPICLCSVTQWSIVDPGECQGCQDLALALTGMSDLPPNCIKLTQTTQISNFFRSDFSTFSRTTPKCTEIWSENLPDLFQLRPIWPKFGRNRPFLIWKQYWLFSKWTNWLITLLACLIIVDNLEINLGVVSESLNLWSAKQLVRKIVQPLSVNNWWLSFKAN